MASRSAISKHYQLKGYDKWLKDPRDGKCYGNPSSAPLVGQFMSALKKKKAKSGEAPESAKALSPEDMQNLFDLCLTRGNSGARQWVCV